MGHDESDKPEKCPNCGSEDILGPYRSHQPQIQIGVLSSLWFDIFVCADCGYAMQFTSRKNVRYLIEKARKRQEKSTK